MVVENKDSLRKAVLEKLLSLTNEEIGRRSKNVEKNISQLPIYKQAKTIMAYYPLRGEVNILGIIGKVLGNKRVCFPVIDSESKNLIPYAVGNLQEDFVKGPHGVMQPDITKTEEIDTKTLDLVLAPALAYDHKKNRLGRGAGYYDRFITELGGHTRKIGVAFDLQIVQDLPVCIPHDQKVDFVVTESSCF